MPSEGLARSREPRRGAPSRFPEFEAALPELFALYEPEPIAEGGLWTVLYRVQRRGRFRPAEREAAVLKVYGLKDTERRFFEKERERVAELFDKLRDPQTPACPNLASFDRIVEGPWEGRAIFALIGDYYPLGDLDRWRRTKDRISLELLEAILLGVFRGLAFLHEECRWVHHDIKPQNILLKEGADGLEALIGDFGAALPQDRTVTANQQLTYLYAPPNPIDDFGRERYDVFSLTCVLAFLIRGDFSAAERDYGRISSRVLDAAAARETIAGVDRRWYRDMAALLRQGTASGKSRPTLARLKARFLAANRRARRRLERRRWFAETRSTLALAGAALAVSAALVGVRAWRWSAPQARLRSESGAGLSWEDGGAELWITRPDAPRRIALRLTTPGPIAAATLASAKTDRPGWRAGFLVWDRSWMLAFDEAAGSALLLELDEEGALRQRPSGAPLIPPWLYGEPARGLAPAAGGLVRWGGSRVEYWQRGDLRWSLAGSWEAPRPIAGVAPAGAAVEVTLADGGARRLGLPFFDPATEEDE